MVNSNSISIAIMVFIQLRYWSIVYSLWPVAFSMGKYPPAEPEAL